MKFTKQTLSKFHKFHIMAIMYDSVCGMIVLNVLFIASKVDITCISVDNIRLSHTAS